MFSTCSISDLKLGWFFKAFLIWIIETKGGESDSGTSENIDKYTEKKFIALKEYAEHYNINFGFVRNRDIEDQSKLFLNNSEYTEDMSNNWKPIENFIK